MPRKVIMMKGLPASGKSTIAQEMIDKNPGVYKRLNKDSLRLMLDNNHWTKNNEAFILDLRDHLITKSLDNGKSVIIDDTNLHPKHEKRIKEIVCEYNFNNTANVQFEILYIEADVEECIKRDIKRPFGVGEKVIRDMYDKFIEHQKYKDPVYLEQDTSLPKAIIVDLDGTLAILNGRDPYNASNCDTNDLPNASVVHVVQTYRNAGIKIIIVSGRHGVYKDQSIKFLEKNEIPYDHLYMRGIGDYRDDRIVKGEMYEMYIKNKFNVLFVLDDRDKVVKLWRDIGLPCFQVWYGDF